MVDQYLNVLFVSTVLSLEPNQSMRHLTQVVLLLRLARDNYVYPKDLAQTTDTPEPWNPLTYPLRSHICDAVGF